MMWSTRSAAPPASIRPPAVAGSFYPASDAELRHQVDALLRAAQPGARTTAPKALILPHAGYVYSGPVAASGYAQLAPLAGRIRRVVLMGPVHRVPVRGLALPGVQRFDTPLGGIDVDADAVAALRDLPQVVESPRAHAAEHSLEVHLPFLQRALGAFTLLPLAVGDATPQEVQQVLDRVWGGAETLIVISSDLSHYLPYDEARAADHASVAAMLALDPHLDHHQACGATPVNGLLLAARRRRLAIELLDLRNSGDTAGDRSRVVGYAALALYEPAAAHDDRGPVLLAQARAAIAAALGLPAAPAPDAAFLHAPGASFVTLKRAGELRGCIGSLEAELPLGEDVRRNAVAAALHDTRFASLSAAELPRATLEVSVLSPATPVAAASEAELLAQLRPGTDGLTLQLDDRRATFLPQVWAQLPAPREFLAQLKRKAGLPADFWSPALRFARYTVDKFSEDDA